MKKVLAFAIMAMACIALAACSGGAGSASSASQSSSAGSSAQSASSASAGSVSAAQGTADLSQAGTYKLDVALTGAASDVSVESPAQVIVAEDGTMTATIVWSSPDYDLMIVGGEEYYPVPRTGNATFTVPVVALDQDIPIQAEATAASEPRMIDCTLRFDSSTATAA